MEFHQIANLFPMLPQAELEALAADIKDHGLNNPVLLFEQKVLDGRNRLKACELAGVKVKTQQFKGTYSEAVAFVWSENFHRRHLTSSQAAMSVALRKKLDPDFMRAVVEPLVEEAKERKVAGKGADGSGGRGKKKNHPKKVSAGKNETRTKIAKMHGTNATSIADCEKIIEEHPEQVEAIKNGEKSVAQIKRENTKKAALANIQSLPSDKFRVIYADPPWAYSDKQGGSISENYGAAEKHYPSMPIKDICAMGVKEMTTDDAVLFLWATSPLLPDGLRVVESWGFKYKSAFVWDKVKHNMGHYNSVRHEFLLVATKGSCTPDVAKLFDSVQSIERTDQHSQKPEEFRGIIDTLYPNGRRIELFARAAVDGWERWGAES